MSKTTSRPQAVYFDSNILLGGGWPFPSAQLLQVLGKARAADLDIGLPELVHREITEHWLRELFSKHQRVAEQIKSFNRAALGFTQGGEPSRLPDLAEMRIGLVAHTKDFTEQFRLVPTIDRLASHYTELALQRRGAFGEKGQGFHDTVILCSVIDDMVQRKYHHAILVSQDSGFRLDGVRLLADEANVQLTIAESLATLEKRLDEEISAKIAAIIMEGKRRVIEAVKAHEAQLVDFLRQQLAYTRGPLDPLFSMNRREFLGIVGYENAHASHLTFGQEPDTDNKFSVEVRVSVREQSEEFRETPGLSTIGFGYYTVHPENIISKTAEREMVVTVEGEADVSAKGVEAIRFMGLRETTFGSGLASLLSQSG